MKWRHFFRIIGWGFATGLGFFIFPIVFAIYYQFIATTCENLLICGLEVVLGAFKAWGFFFPGFALGAFLARQTIDEDRPRSFEDGVV